MYEEKAKIPLKISTNIRSLFLFSHLKDIWDDMRNFPYALIKGEALSLLAYNDVAQRKYNDIDILVDRVHIKTLENVLTKHKFICDTKNRKDKIFYLATSHQSSPYYKKMGENVILIDINFDILWGEYTGNRINISKFLSDTIEIDMYGCKIKTLQPLKALIQLILHHYKDMNSIYRLADHNSINYNMFKDVYYLWKNNRNLIPIDKLYSISEEYGIMPFVFYILYFTNEIFHDEDLKQYVKALKTNEGIELLNYYGLSEKERKLWKVDFKTRLEAVNIFNLIKDDFKKEDFKKLEHNRNLFG